VADTLELFDKRITNDPKILKEVNNLKGVGKGSMATVSTYVPEQQQHNNCLPAWAHRQTYSIWPRLSTIAGYACLCSG
jgi:hypothetical protein